MSVVEQVAARRHRGGVSVLLHVLPGAVAALIYFSLVPLGRQLGLPTAATLAVSAFLGVAPVQLAIMALAGRASRDGAKQPVILFRTRVRWPVTAALAVGLVVWAAAVFVLTRPVADWVLTHLFGWWPRIWLVDLGTSTAFGTPQLIVTAVLLLVGTVLVAPVVEELYFRGFLLPRLPERLGRLAPVAHSALFALYHLWSPWLGPTRVLAILPLSYVVWRTGSVRIAIVAHILLNALDLIVLVAYLASSRF